MIHKMHIVGQILEVSKSTPKDPTKKPSAIVTLQWGVAPEGGGQGNTIRINAGLIRVPNYLFPKVEEQLVSGAWVNIDGHLQGVHKNEAKLQAQLTGLAKRENSSGPRINTELVADRIEFLKAAPAFAGINEAFIVGRILKVLPRPTRDPKRPSPANLFVQWGPEREETTGPVNFVNAGLVFVPGFLFEKKEKELQPGEFVAINAALQGIHRTFGEDSETSVELVTSKVRVLTAVEPDTDELVESSDSAEPAAEVSA